MDGGGIFSFEGLICISVCFLFILLEFLDYICLREDSYLNFFFNFIVIIIYI